MTATIPARRAEPERGRTTIADRGVERIAVRAVTEAAGVGGAATRVLGVAIGAESLANDAEVTAKVSGDTATLDVRLSVAYPAPVAKTTEAARRHLILRIGELTGLTVSRVDITVTSLPGSVPEKRRVQ
ncbi:Asp23/Gls24 family envelope stress response protein [Amycolatopsis sp. cmx-4-68]|uniref:Asp23/Gls24 family envelope stress response protein n=1 Tax=Amycolatopsis sp. cmx-4-68 TaxID=2790938 RepID=UPI00397BC468